MYSVTRRHEHLEEDSRTALFEGEAYGSGVSFFWVDNAPGEGPPLHRHPYSETWALIAGEALITADGEEIEARAGHIVVVGPGTPHKFLASGTDRVHMICIHDSPRRIEEPLEDDGAGLPR